MEAFILLKVKGDHRKIMEEISKFDYVRRVYNIAGDRDVLVEVEMKKLDDLKDLINKIRSIDNILETTSYIALSRYK
ncbi:MAG: Lrp/AsnC ligand binding domain-containing protein [Candidatus Bathyarchaeia archaeon]